MVEHRLDQRLDLAHRFVALATYGLLTNDLGVNVGAYVDAEYVQHAYVHYIYNKTYFSFDIPGGVNPYAWSINNKGDIVGEYQFGSSGNWAGYQLRQGHLTAFDVPGAISSFPQMITGNQKIAGTYQLADGFCHGFVATPDGCNQRPAFQTLGALARELQTRYGLRAYTRVSQLPDQT